MLRVQALLGATLVATFVCGGALASGDRAEAGGAPYVSASPLGGIRFNDAPVPVARADVPNADVDPASPMLRPGDLPGAGIDPALSSSRRVVEPGWHFSGRIGPLRWLTPLDGDGDTEMRFGGRVYGQPRMPGAGNFNVGINYNF